ncbi:hypothetical protein STIUS_v1c05790 [Spiroplasma sp. TIUS-1]|uniref:hypothetical protein n=1 Tax=Spiroplasma sp. TIUS-1 TaxID=216963 RepID=UPI001398CE7C|nr:hypothetical protein [Spiroplasma sp. TIUS-1]QHX36133.1 hypothetical protein STIUS_v1c05790 [Spiroplasma sp. TIUS-1]
MNLLRKVENTDPNLFWIWIGIMIVGLILAVVFGWLTWHINNQNNKYMNKKNRESNSIWEFTKKNFPIFVTLFGVILFITALMFIIQTS